MLIVRDAVDADLAAVARIHTRAWKVAYRGQLPSALLDNLDVSRRLESWRQLLAQDDDLHLLVAVARDEQDCPVVGFVCVTRSRDQDAGPACGEVQAIYVDPGQWRRGYGASLLNAGEQRLRQQGFTTATLWVLSTNASTRAFYEHHGWHPDGAIKADTVGDMEVREIRYRTGL